MGTVDGEDADKSADDSSEEDGNDADCNDADNNGDVVCEAVAAAVAFVWSVGMDLTCRMCA